MKRKMKIGSNILNTHDAMKVKKFVNQNNKLPSICTDKHIQKKTENILAALMTRKLSKRQSSREAPRLV